MSRKVLSAEDFVLHCQTDSPRRADSLLRWDMLYEHYGAEICDRRQAAYRRFYGVPISTRSSTELCLNERYTACVNFCAPDGVVRHVCDILPIVLGSRLDRRIRADFWRDCDAGRCDGARCDRRKCGLLVQNKNLYHFTVTMATNPKVAHIYRKSNKLNKVDSRVYYYDKNFRGNMFCFKQNVVLLPCRDCLLRRSTPCTGGMRCLVIEELYLRNCFKQDYLLLRRCCWPDRETCRDTVHCPTYSLLTKFVQQYEQKSTATAAAVEKSEDNSSVASLLSGLGSCGQALQRCCGASMLKSNDVSFENDLRTFVQMSDGNGRAGEADAIRVPMDKIYVNINSDRDSRAQLLCNCSSEDIRASFDRCLNRHRLDDSAVRGNGEAGERVGTNGSSRAGRGSGTYMLTFVDNLQEFRKISDNCFPRQEDDGCCNAGTPSAPGVLTDSYYEEQLYTIYVYMRQIIARNEDIDQLCNKCVFDGPYLYNKLLHQLREYISHRVSVQDIKSVLVDTLVSRYRQLAHTANLYMLISSKTNIRVELANDMKRSLKLSVKREKMQQSEYVVSTCNGVTSSSVVSRPSDILTGALTSNILPTAAAGHVDGTTAVDPYHQQQSATDEMNDDVNEKCDFVILTNCSSSKTKNLCTELLPARNMVYVASCNANDVIARQLITYSGNNLLQNISAAHFTDLEFVFETVKRPSVANQHNSIKCSFMPRGAIRFLSYYNMGNLSSAGRTLNVCFRNTVTFFLDYDGVIFHFQRWLIQAYTRLCSVFRLSRGPDVCVEHGVQSCNSCLRCILINEVPFVSLRIDRHFETLMFFLVKLQWPAAQFYRKAGDILSVTLISGIIMIPMILDRGDRSLYPRITGDTVLPLLNDCWRYCDDCSRYYPLHSHDRASNLAVLPVPIARQFDRLGGALSDLRVRRRDGGIVSCDQHVWFSSNDLEYYETVVCGGRCLDPPFVYEISCHGLLLNCNFMHATDISKLTVSINASRRRLRTSLGSARVDHELEMLVDQNSRMSVREWSRSTDAVVQSLTDDHYEPLDSVVELQHNNMFRCCFMFGDFHGRNVEDAYVFDSNSRPLLDNTVQLKMNFYRNDKLPVATESLRLHFKPTVSVYHSGVVFFLGDLISNYRLSFGSTFVHVKIIRVSEHLWIYKFYYINNASYLRQDESIFRDYPRGCEFVDEVETKVACECDDGRGARRGVRHGGGVRRGVRRYCCKKSDDRRGNRGGDRHSCDSSDDGGNGSAVRGGNRIGRGCHGDNSNSGYRDDNVGVIGDGRTDDDDSVAGPIDLVDLSVNELNDESYPATLFDIDRTRPRVLTAAVVRTVASAAVCSRCRDDDTSHGRGDRRDRRDKLSHGDELYHGDEVPRQTRETSEAEPVRPSSSGASSAADDASASGSSQACGGGNMVRMLFERTVCTRNGMVRIRCQMTNKQLRFLVTLRGVRSVLKWQNNCGNKGVSSCVDLSDLYTSRGGRVHAVVSAYSTIGRQLVAQLLEQMSRAGSATDYNNGRYIMRVFSKRLNGRQVGWCGYGNFFFSCDSPHDTIIVSSPSYGNNATRMCNMTYFAAIGNNLSTWIGNRSANHVNYRNNPINGMPLNINKCLSVYHSYNRQLYMKRLLLREYRKKMQDNQELWDRGIRSSLPLSIASTSERDRTESSEISA